VGSDQDGPDRSPLSDERSRSRGTTYSYAIGGYAIGTKIQLPGSFLFVDDNAVGNDFQVHRVGASGYTTYATSNVNSIAAFFVWPPIILEDWYKFRGTAVDENLVVVADSVNTTKLTSDLEAGGLTIAVEELNVFQPSGFACCGNEFIQYSGKSATSGPGNLTGCTRGTYGTSAVKHYTQEKISQGLWMVKINGSVLLAGYVKPS
jgi:hypothetical protein